MWGLLVYGGAHQQMGRATLCALATWRGGVDAQETIFARR
jgi:NAD(P)H-hydrate repair Nnr-like enzyme with NAD(P)H-hydrate dehydratase domain